MDNANSASYDIYDDKVLLPPVLFIGHGSPMNAIEKNSYNLQWAELGKKLPKPKAILCVSAHWVTNGVKVTAMNKPRTIHDFHGFPKKLISQEYPAPGAPDLAELTVKNVVYSAIHADFEWGLDHGTWSVLLPMFPAADIPVYQLSLDNNLSLKQHYELGKELQFLRAKGVMIIGSGNIVHNLRLMNFNNKIYDWAKDFDAYIKNAILNRDYSLITGYEKFGTGAKLSVPTTEHFLPLLYTLALGHDNEQISFFNESIDVGSISMRSLIIS